MYECPNCGANLQFDIASQKLLCRSCNASLDPYAFQKEKDAIEDYSFNVTTFTCPQCGGEIYSSDDTAAAFCSFCGASTILDSRISHKRRPKYIIPFQRTKEDCKKSYMRMMRFAFFAPKELKDPKYIDSFRGIYMPYWSYNISNKGPISLSATRRHRRGDYIITNHYALEGDLDAGYEGISYDASSSFSDAVSEAIAPFDLSQQKNFTPAFLSGFYADTSDIGSDTYKSDARKQAADMTFKKIRKERAFRSHSLNLSSDAANKEWTLHTACDQVDHVMYPVWFLAYRNKDRVAYATVNGQTGKAAADLPADPKKFLIASFVTAVPIFILLNLFFTVKPTAVMALSGLLALAASFLYFRELSQIIKKEFYVTDKGLLAKKQAAKVNQPLSQSEIDEWNHALEKSRGKGKSKYTSLKKSLKRVGLILAASYIMPVLLLFGIRYGSVFLWGLLFLANAVFTFLSWKKRTKLDKMSEFPFFLGSSVAVLIGLMITAINPVSDLFYYAGAMLSLFAVCFTMLDLIRYYNILATRKLPQFNRTGGDDRA